MAFVGVETVGRSGGAVGRPPHNGELCLRLLPESFRSAQRPLPDSKGGALASCPLSGRAIVLQQAQRVLFLQGRAEETTNTVRKVGVLLSPGVLAIGFENAAVSLTLRKTNALGGTRLVQRSHNFWTQFLGGRASRCAGAKKRPQPEGTARRDVK